jgi:glycosyltransferase involved in cell wall biosynthesis
MIREPDRQKRLRIAVLNRHFSATAGGAERYSVALVEQLAARHEFHVFAQHIDHHWPGVTYHKVSYLFRRPRWINQLWYATCTWWATRTGFDVVHSHEITWHGQVQTVHVLPIYYNLFDGRGGWKFFLRWVKLVTSPRLLVYVWLEHFRFAQKPHRSIVATSGSLLKTMRESYPNTSSMLKMLSPGVLEVSGLASDADKQAARIMLGLPLSRPVILFVANDYRKKGLGSLLLALSKLSENVVLAVVGNPVQLSEFRAMAQDLGLAARVFFLGSLIDMSTVYRAADVLTHPTHEDTFAMVVLEAMAHGLPVVVTGLPYCGISGLLTDGVNALVLDDPSNLVLLAEKIELILKSESLRLNLGAAAIEFAKQHLWSRIAQKQEQIYRLT